MVQEEDIAIMEELPQDIKSRIFKDFLFQDFLQQFTQHFYFERPEAAQDRYGFQPRFDWHDTKYSEFMIRLLGALEPRLFSGGEYIFEEDDDVDEHLYVISRDKYAAVNSTG